MSGRDNPSAARRLARKVIWALGIPDLLYRLQERRIANAAPPGPTADDGLPLPPPLLRVLVCGSASADEFLAGGKATVAEFDELFSRHGRSMAASRAILDIGCGCGRLARWVARRCGGYVAGVDINRALVRWSQRNLPGVWRLIRLRQPLPFKPGEFDLAYACSVVTHLREDTTSAWFEDLRRVLCEGGLLLVTFHDEHHASAGARVVGDATVADRLAQGGYAVEIDRMEGSNRLAAYVTARRLSELAGAGFRRLDYRKSTETACLQAIAVFQRV